jgi:hypothetical protein
MNLRRAAVPVVMMGALAMAHTASAQQTDQPDPLDNALVRIGPLGINPSITIHDAGRDENVFNDPANPKSDFTFTLSPRAEVLFRPRVVHVDFITATDYVYYRTYASERGTDESSTLRADFDLARVQPFVSVQGINSKNRYNQEVDVRARHQETSYGAGAAFRIATRTNITVGVRRTDLSFDPGATFRGTDLAASFDSRLQSADVSMGVELTPFTTAALTVTEDQQRFTVSHDRDANTLRISPTISFSPQALLKGSVSVGYSRFTPLSSAVPGWSGLTSTINLSTALLGRYQIEGLLSRGIQYSYDLATPYYVTTGGTATLTVVLFGPLDVKATGTRQLMAYRTEETADTVAGTTGSDTFTSYGGGVGYRIRNRMRLGVNADWSNRASQIAVDRAYRNRRVYALLTWGVQQ